MSALFWLFGLGALTIAFPLLFHLIRRTPKGQTEFSSLMFLRPSPPSLTRRSRLENLLLLALRMLAIGLIAFAFMRPYFPAADKLNLAMISKRRVAILLDTSASMQRADLWQQATASVNEILDQLEPGDEVALLTFDSAVRPIVNFETQVVDAAPTSNALSAGNTTLLAQQQSIKEIREKLPNVKPGFAKSDLGRAMVTVADQLSVWHDQKNNRRVASSTDSNSKLQIMVVSDMQKGSDTSALQAYEWPSNVYVDFRTVNTDQGNATVEILPPIAESDEPATQRVRVRNFENSAAQQFAVTWVDGDNREQKPTPFFVPADTSRVIEIKDPAAMGANEFFLAGDTEAFDNSYFKVPIQKQEMKIGYLQPADNQDADQPDDPEAMLFYLIRALGASPKRTVEVQQFGPGNELTEADMLVLTAPVATEMESKIDRYLDAGGTLLIVFHDEDTVKSTANWTAAQLATVPDKPENKKSEYAMLAEIDFSHPLFTPFDSPQFNDFTSIKFWNHQRVELETDPAIHVLARFDDDYPAIWQRNPSNGGDVVVFSSGWHPSDSQLARSTKFVPILNSLLDMATAAPTIDGSVSVNESIEFVATDFDRQMVKPDGSKMLIESGKSQYSRTDLPGIYTLRSEKFRGKTTPANAEQQRDEGDHRKKAGQDSTVGESESTTDTMMQSNGSIDQVFAVNIDRTESETKNLPTSQLEMFQVKVGQHETATSELQQLRQLRDIELEDKQKVWKWLVLLALAVLLIETGIASRK